MSDVLIDSSVWIDFLRGDAVAIRRLDPLLADGRVATTGPVFAEVLSGVQHRSAFDRLARLLKSLEWLSPSIAVWEQIAEARFVLANQGTQAHLIDLLIALTALQNGHSLLTRDLDFNAIAQIVPIEVEVI